MKIIGFTFEKISAERKEPKKGEIKINSNIDIRNITKEKISGFDEEVVKIEFEFTVNYEPDIAKILFKGYVMLSTDKDKLKEIVKKWKSKKLLEEIKIPLFNFILTKSNIKALQLEEELNLPTHVPLPRVKAEKDTNRSYVN